MSKKPFPTKAELEVRKQLDEEMVVHVINKKTMREYELIEMRIVNGTVTDRKVLHTDIPIVVIGRLFHLLSVQK